MEAHGGLTLAVALTAGVFAQAVARQLGFPSIVLLLALGTAVGPEGLGWVTPRSLGAGLFEIVNFGVAIILFEGGLNLELGRLRSQEAPIRRLVTIGAMVTLVGATLAARMLLGWSWDLAVLFGSLVTVTGPTVVAPLLRDMRLQPKLKHLLEAEGVLIDPIGAILALLVLEIILVPSAERLASETLTLLVRIGFGVGMGVAGGFVIGWLLGLRRLVPQGFENIVTLALVILLYQACDQVLAHTGLFAVTVAGVVVGSLQTPVDRDLREFKDQLTVMLVALLFVLLAADVQLKDVGTLGWPGVIVIGALVVAVRPLTVWASTRASELTLQERLFMAWVAPRGIIAAAIASLTAATMEDRGIAGGAELQALVFMTIAGTVLLAGLTARPVASLLSLRLPRRDRVAILGVRPLSLLLATEIREAGGTVVFLDSDPNRCREAEDAGFPVVYGDALQERTLIRAHFDLVGTAIGFTSNDHLNMLFVSQAKELFQVPQVDVALEPEEWQKPPDRLKRLDGDVLFWNAPDLRRWDLRVRHDDVTIEQLEYHPPETEPETAGEQDSKQKARPKKAGDPYLILTVKRKDRVAPMTIGFEPKAGDMASVAMYGPNRDEAVRALKEMGWRKPTPQPEVPPAEPQLRESAPEPKPSPS